MPRSWVAEPPSQLLIAMPLPPPLGFRYVGKQEIVKNGQHDPQMPPVATDVQTIFDTMTEGWEYNEKLEVLEKFFGEDSVNTMLRFIKASDLNEFKQFIQTYIEERKNT